jgi:hypothetical protein
MAKAQANVVETPVETVVLEQDVVETEATPEVEAIDINEALRLVEEAAAQYPLASQIVTHVEGIRSLIRIK